jgi:hypothetical protein
LADRRENLPTQLRAKIDAATRQRNSRSSNEYKLGHPVEQKVGVRVAAE